MLSWDIIDINFATTKLFDVMNNAWVNKPQGKAKLRLYINFKLEIGTELYLPDFALYFF